MIAPVEQLGSTHNGAIMVGRGIVIARYWGGTSVEDVGLMRTGFESALDASANVALLIVIDESATAPDRQARDALGRMLGDFSDRISAWAGSVAGTGLAASSKRTLMRVVLSLARLRCPWVIQATPELASSWLSTTLQLRDGAHASAWLEGLRGARDDAALPD